MERFSSRVRKPQKKTAFGSRVIRKDEDDQRYVLAGGIKQYLTQRKTDNKIDTVFGNKVLKEDEKGEYFNAHGARYDIIRSKNGTITAYNVNVN